MSRPILPLQQLCRVAIKAASRAGEFIQNTDRSELQRHFKSAGSSAASQIVTEVDIRSEGIIRECLQATCDHWDIAFVGEETSQTGGELAPERLGTPYYWCVDPLDGTLPFVEGKPGYAVSIALVDQSGSPLMGVVYDPSESTVTHAIKGQGAYRNGVAIVQRSGNASSLTAFADASFKTDNSRTSVLAALNRCASHLHIDGVVIIEGSGAVKNACQVLDSEAACYVKPPKAQDGGGSIWDFAATACIVKEAGGWASNIYGEPLELNRSESTFMNHQGVIYASSKQIARVIIESL